MGGGIFHSDRNDFFLYFSRNEQIRKASSSGGAFSFFAEKVLAEGGVVYASRYNFTENRLEVADSDRFPLDEFRKSKYMESNTLRAFSEIHGWLRRKRRVLFCGTPCQVAGLKSFLGKSVYQELLTIDFFCHGVPANSHFTAFKQTLEMQNGGACITNFDFRYKDSVNGTGWHDLIFKTDFSDGTFRIFPYKPPYYYLYYRPFEDRLVLRRCCYDCCIVNQSRADVTIGDFWNIRDHAPELDDNRGISVVKLHTEQARELWKFAAKEGTVAPLPYETVESAYRRQHTANLHRRNKLAGRIEKNGFIETMRRHYRREYLLWQIRRFIKTIVGRG